MTELGGHVPGTHVFAAVAYSHLLSLISESDGFIVETVQAIAFPLLPMLPVVQLIHDALKIILHVCSSKSWNTRYLVSAFCGQCIYKSKLSPGEQSFRDHIPEVPVQMIIPKTRGSWTARRIGRFQAIVANLSTVMFTVIAYFHRLRMNVIKILICQQLAWIIASAGSLLVG